MRFDYKQMLIFSALVFRIAIADAAGIEAVVNDNPISAFDVDNRAQLIQLQEGGSGTVSSELRRRALAQLVAEEVKAAELKQQNIVISKEDIDRAIHHIEMQNGLADGYFEQEFQARGIEEATLRRQIAADLGWMRLVQRDMPEVALPKDAVKQKKAELAAALKKDRYHVAEIVTNDEDKALEAWQKIQEGMPFPEAVAAYSIGDSKAEGGLVGWIEKTHYPKAVADVLTKMTAGQVSRPIASGKTYVILGLMEKRPAAAGDVAEVWEVAQALVPDTLTVKYKTGDELAGGCDEFKEVLTDYALPGSLVRGGVSPYQLPPDLTDVLTPLPLKTMAGPITTPAGQVYLMKCAMKRQSLMPSDEAIRAQLEMEAFEKVAERLYQAAEKKAVIEYKESR